MDARDLGRLLEDVEREVLRGARSIGILGLSPIALRITERLGACGAQSVIGAIYTDIAEPPLLAIPIRRFAQLCDAAHDLLVVAGDRDKESLLDAALPYVRGTPRLVIGGYRHFEFTDPIFDEARRDLAVPSLANGYPHTLVHLYQCLANAARLGLDGVVAEFGMFRGGTTMFLSRVIERLGQRWPVIGFDTFAGFPSRRSTLDLYDHPDCVTEDVVGVRRYLDGRDVEIVVGDVVETCGRLAREHVVLTFLDTDNYSSARAVLDVVRDRTVVGGAIVFDHFTGRDRFCYTLGERMAGRVLLLDRRYFHLHDSGVFLRQCA